MIRKSIFMATLTLLIGGAPVFAAINAAPGLREDAQASRAAAREVDKQRWEELKTNREAKREEVKANVQAKREEVKANIQNMRDVRKKQVVELVQQRFGNVNARRTEHFLNVLERLSTILDKIQSRTEKAKSEGKSVGSIETAIASARTAISSAESAVNAQKAKSYQVTVTGDGAARGEVEASVKLLHADLRAVQDTVAAARQAVHDVYQQIKTVVGSDKGRTPIATGSSATQ